jgi:hypothetical protein
MDPEYRKRYLEDMADFYLSYCQLNIDDYTEMPEGPNRNQLLTRWQGIKKSLENGDASPLIKEMAIKIKECLDSLTELNSQLAELDQSDKANIDHIKSEQKALFEKMGQYMIYHDELGQYKKIDEEPHSSKYYRPPQDERERIMAVSHKAESEKRILKDRTQRQIINYAEQIINDINKDPEKGSERKIWHDIIHSTKRGELERVWELLGELLENLEPAFDQLAHNTGNPPKAMNQNEFAAQMAMEEHLQQVGLQMGKIAGFRRNIETILNQTDND